MQWKPNVTVAAIAERSGRFLLVEENVEGEILFNQPAGHLEHGETLLEAVQREVLEETAYKFTPQHLVGVYLYPNPRNDIVYLRFCFAGTCAEEPLEAELDAGIIRTHWLSREEMSNLGEQLRSRMVIHCIDDYQKGRRYPLELLNHFPVAAPTE
jgi:ADP-ribose pyrophosphatase YjhB (NUDIX family)